MFLFQSSGHRLSCHKHRQRRPEVPADVGQRHSGHADAPGELRRHEEIPRRYGGHRSEVQVEADRVGNPRSVSIPQHAGSAPPRVLPRVRHQSSRRCVQQEGEDFERPTSRRESLDAHTGDVSKAILEGEFPELLLRHEGDHLWLVQGDCPQVR